MTSPPSDVPDPALPRLFIGGLIPLISTPALLRLISKFAKPGPYYRHPHRPFAYVSVIPHDETSLTRCVASLNNTVWCGASLRVQQARQHFWHRLQQEWEHGQAAVSDEHVADDDPRQQNGEETRHVPFEKVAKGQHTRFSFPDVEPCDVVELLRCDDNYLDDDSAEHEDMKEKAILRMDVDDVNSTPHAPSKKRMKTKPSALSVTMDLFGLPTSPPAIANAANVAEAGNNEHAVAIDLTRPLKRPRKALPDMDPNKPTRDAGSEPDVIDVESEKTTALSVLHSMFPELSPPEMTWDERISAHRRLGLFRKLRATRPDPDSPKLSLQRAEREQKPSQVVLDTQTVRSANVTDIGKVRRAGLYRKLAFTPSSTTTSYLPAEQNT